MSTRMTSEEIDAFLDGERTLVLVTLRRDGTPVAHPLWFVRIGRRVYVNTGMSSAKTRNALRDPRVCAVVEAGERYFELRGVRLEGRCEPVQDPDEVARVEQAMAEKDRRLGSGLTELPAWFGRSRSARLGRGERVLLRIPMERVYSWDFSRARRRYEGTDARSGGKG
jgi:PPOX class probable F420-dependent enzyme